MRFAYALSVLLGIAGVAAAAPARDALVGFNGLAFGTTFDAAKTQLGSGAEAGENTAKPPSKTLRTKEEHFGETLSVQYVFANDGRFSAATGKIEVPSDDISDCEARWPRIVALLKDEFGEPDTEKKDALLNQVVFNFADGAIVRANRTGCLMLITFKSPFAAKAQ